MRQTFAIKDQVMCLTGSKLFARAIFGTILFENAPLALRRVIGLYFKCSQHKTVLRSKTFVLSSVPEELLRTISADKTTHQNVVCQHSRLLRFLNCKSDFFLSSQIVILQTNSIRDYETLSYSASHHDLN